MQWCSVCCPWAACFLGRLSLPVLWGFQCHSSYSADNELATLWWPSILACSVCAILSAFLCSSVTGHCDSSWTAWFPRNVDQAPIPLQWIRTICSRPLRPRAQGIPLWAETSGWVEHLFIEYEIYVSSIMLFSYSQLNRYILISKYKRRPFVS